MNCKEHALFIMKRFSQILFLSLLILSTFTGCSSLPEHNYIGMTKQEVAAHLEKHAFRDRWSGNKFKIEVPQKQWYSRNYKNASAVAADKFMMSAKKWRCGFYPQRHWLFGWDGIFSKWHFVTLKFKDDRVAEQHNLRNYYWVYGHAGKSPHPQFPWNFHKVNENLYRSGQPDEDEFESLYTFNGIRSVLNLRESSRSKRHISAINKKWKNAITLYEIPIDTDEISEKDLYKILTTLRDAPKPVLIHCLLGSNRTGCAVAAYRIVFDNWRVEDAVNEFMKPEYGHHKIIYPHISALLRKINWKNLQTAVLNSGNTPTTQKFDKRNR